MSRRRNYDPPAFGSDSFLDIVANIVGILIILMVVVGVRASRAPVSLPTAAIVADPASRQSSIPVLEPLTESEPPALAVEEEPPHEPTPQVIHPYKPVPIVTTLPQEPIRLLPLPEVKVPKDLADEAQRLAQHRDALADQYEALKQSLGQLRTRSDRSKSALSNARQLAALVDERRQAADAEALSALELVQQGEEYIRKLEEQVAAARENTEPTETLEHVTTPVSRLVEGREVHYRLSGNRVSYVPVNELASRLKTELSRRRDTIMSRNLYRGEVGPLVGYKMEYTVKRQSLSLEDELRYGRGIVRMIVSDWTLRPEADLVTESHDEALKSGSRFLYGIRSAGPGTTITFWIYPDSFELHDELKAFVQESGFRVASRPLPEGVPIAGSPQGSKSLAQ